MPLLNCMFLALRLWCCVQVMTSQPHLQDECLEPLLQPLLQLRWASCLLAAARGAECRFHLHCIQAGHSGHLYRIRTLLVVSCCLVMGPAPSADAGGSAGSCCFNNKRLVLCEAPLPGCCLTTNRFAAAVAFMGQLRDTRQTNAGISIDRTEVTCLLRLLSCTAGPRWSAWPRSGSSWRG
jgi:hypothetical protein